jgi:hypothetical protein
MDNQQDEWVADLLGGSHNLSHILRVEVLQTSNDLGRTEWREKENFQQKSHGRLCFNSLILTYEFLG